MNIGIDYSLVKVNPSSGMGVYVSEIVSNLKKINKNRYFLFNNNRRLQGSLVGKLMSFLKELVWVNFSMARLLSNHKIDLLYFPNPPSPFFSSVPVVLTIPDLSFFWDRTINPILKTYLYVLYFLSAHSASFITTFSLSSKQDICKILKIHSSKVEIISPAVKKNFTKKKTKNKNFINQEIRKHYILSVPGTFIARKNAIDLIKAYSTLPEKVKNECSLVLVGNTNDGYFKIFYESLKKQNLLRGVIFTGYVSEKELVDLYSRADLFVVTSLYEGFGLTPLEAMACGVPVISYRNSSLIEVVEGAGLLVSNKKQLRDAILKITRSSSLRGRLIKSGFLRAKEFSWKNSSIRLSGVFERIYYG